MSYCSNLSIEGNPQEHRVNYEGHLEYRCKITKNLCVARAFTVSGGAGRTDFLEYDSEIAERCPSYELDGKTGTQIMEERKEAKRQELSDRISQLQTELGKI